MFLLPSLSGKLLNLEIYLLITSMETINLRNLPRKKEKNEFNKPNNNFDLSPLVYTIEFTPLRLTKYRPDAFR